MHISVARLMALLLAVSGSTTAQFRSLSTTFDGSRLFFVSELAQTGSGQPTFGKLFLAENGEVRLLVAFNRMEVGGTDRISCNNSYNMVNASIAGDGSSLGVTATRDCVGGTPRGEEPGMPRAIVYDNAGREVTTARGTLVLGPNGRWGISTMKAWDGPYSIYELVDAEKQLSESVIPLLGRNTQNQIDVANDGTFLLSDPQLTVFTKDCRGNRCAASGQSRLLDERPALAAQISADAATVVWIDQGREFQVSRPGVFGSARRSLGSPRGELAMPAQLWMSDDARVVVYLARPASGNSLQAFAIDTASGVHRQVTTLPDGVESATLSGNGRVVWLVSGNGSLMRLDLETSALTSLTGPASGFRPLGYRVAAGQPVTLSAFVKDGKAPSVRIGGKPAPVLSASDGRVTVQVPWDVKGYAAAVMENAATRDWEPSAAALTVEEYWPSPVRSADGHDLIAHQRFDSLVTPDNPARAGEIVHIYATGLGAVNGVVVTGEPAPASPLPTLSAPLSCTAGAPVSVLYAGLAPGLIGYYQVSVRVPGDAQTGILRVSCSTADQLPFQPTLEVSVFVR